MNGAGAFNGIGDVSFERTYDNLFRMLYNLPPNLTDDIEDGEANAYITDCISVLQAADYICALPCVRTYIESYLLRISQKFWVHVAKAPEAWSDIAIRLQSAVIFRESIIHIAGGLDIPGLIKKSRFDQTQHGKICLEVAERKSLELRQKKIDVERRLMQFYPPRIIRRETADKIPGRADYGSDIYYWQALTMIRQFFTSSILANRHHRYKDGGVEFYRTIFRCDYIDKFSADEFHQLFAMSTKGKQCLADAVELIKDDHRAIVSDLLENKLQLRTSARSKPLRYLTCTDVCEEELPWIINPALGTVPNQAGHAVGEGSLSPERGLVGVMNQEETAGSERHSDDEGRGMGVRGEEGDDHDEDYQGRQEAGSAGEGEGQDDDEYMDGA